MVGSAEESGGGVTSVIRLMKMMPVWEKYECYWLGTQIQAGKWTKIGYALWAYIKAVMIMWRYDIVHFHTVPDISMTVQLPVLLLALIERKTVIMHIHCGNQLGMEMCTKNRVAHWCMGKADYIVLLAHCFEELLDEYWPEAIGKRWVVYNAFGISDNGILNNEKSKHIVFAGIFNENKSVDVLVKAFANVHKEHPEWKLQLLGSGPDEDKLRRLISKMNIEDCVEMPGYVHGEEKEKYFRKASIYVMSSRYEGFPMVVLEAWAHAACVVTTPVGGLPDFIIEGENCLTFDFGDSDGLARQLRILMDDENMRRKMGMFGREFVKENFSMEKVNSALDCLWSEVSGY